MYSAKSKANTKGDNHEKFFYESFRVKTVFALNVEKK